MASVSHDTGHQAVTSCALITFELRWYRCGGGPATAIIDQLGLAPRDFFARLLEVLDDPPAPLSQQTVTAMRAVAHRRSWLLE
ncbi:MAG: DUF3263 domain-containing protein [Mycobacterium sp.]|nr:DUF3263 domain-containing protein [Mycobacterium sp.]